MLSLVRHASTIPFLGYTSFLWSFVIEVVKYLLRRFVMKKNKSSVKRSFLVTVDVFDKASMRRACRELRLAAQDCADNDKLDLSNKEHPLVSLINWGCGDDAVVSHYKCVTAMEEKGGN